MPFATVEDYERIFEHSLAISESVEWDEIIRSTLDAMEEVVPGTQVVLGIVEKGAVRVLDARPPVRPQAKVRRIVLGTGLVGRAADGRTTIYSPDLRTDSRISPDVLAVVPPEDRSLLAVPLASGDQTLGVMYAISPVVDGFTTRDAARLVCLGPIVGAAFRKAMVLSRQREARQLRRQLELKKSMFLGLVSEELRLPLQEIAQLCERVRASAPADRAALAGQILEHGNELAALVEKVLSVSVSSELPSDSVAAAAAV